jgi:hypothetical protein
MELQRSGVASGDILGCNAIIEVLEVNDMIRGTMFEKNITN